MLGLMLIVLQTFVSNGQLGCDVVVRFDENARGKIAGYISGKSSERLCKCVKQVKAKTDCDNGLI